MLNFIPNWLPKKSDHVQFLVDERRRCEEELPKAFIKMRQEMETQDKIAEDFLKTLDIDQKEKWFQMKAAGQKAVFQKTRYDHMQRRLDEIPREIEETYA